MLLIILSGVLNDATLDYAVGVPVAPFLTSVHKFHAGLTFSSKMLP